MNPIQIRQLFNHHIGKTVVFKHNIPVVLDGDGRRDNPGAIRILLLHPIQSGGDASQCFTTALLPLKECVPFLQNQIKIVHLLIVQMNPLFILRIVEGESVQPCGDTAVHFHIRKLLLFHLVFTLTVTNHTTIATILGRILIVSNNGIEGDGDLHAVVQLTSHFRAISLEHKVVIPFNQTNFILVLWRMLFPYHTSQIGQYLGFRNTDTAPLFI